MQLINCKITYYIGDNKIYTTELINDDYKIEIDSDKDNLFASIQTNKDLKDFKIEFFIKINKNYTNFITNGYQTWMSSKNITKNSEKSYLTTLMQKFAKGTGFDYLGEYTTEDTSNVSYGLCHFKKENNNERLVFASLNEKDTFTKYNYDFSRSILNITRSFTGYSINKNMELANIIQIENEYNSAFNLLKEKLIIDIDKINNEKIIAYNTYSEFENKINQKLIKEKIYSLENIYNLFILGDGYSECGYDIFSLDYKRFPAGLFPISNLVHTKEIKSAIWLAPFAISPLSKSFTNYQNMIVKQNEKPVITCPYWNGAYSLDITKPESVDYLKRLFDLVCNEFDFDVIYCDCIYMAGSLPTNGKTQAMLINEGIELIRKFTQGKQLILGGLPYLCGINNCDYISISHESKSIWKNPISSFAPQMITSVKQNIQSLANSKYMDILYPAIYSVPDNKHIKSTLLNCIANFTNNIIISQDLIKPKTYPNKLKINKN